MSTGKLLARQLRRAFGVSDALELGEAFEAAAAVAAPQAAALPGFLAMVDASHAQHERDLELRSRSLQLSSMELNAANTALRAQADDQARALESLRATARSLVGGGDAVSASGGDSIEALTDLIRGLIEERRASEAALKESESRANRLALVASRTRNAVVITDAHGRVEWVNRAFSDLTGFECEEVVGRVPGALLQGPDTDLAEVARIGSLGRDIENAVRAGTRPRGSADVTAVEASFAALAPLLAGRIDRAAA